MPQAVHTRNKRFEWVKGWLTGGADPEDGSVECGEGTAFPMEVTLDQLAEIMYRVRDAQWVSGTATRIKQYLDDPEISTFTAVTTFTSYPPPLEKVEYWHSEIDPGLGYPLDAAYTRRGYVTVTNQESPDIPMEDYGINLFSKTAYLGLQLPQAMSVTDYLAFRESINEISLWANAFKDTQPNLVGHYNSGEDLDSNSGYSGYLSSPPNDTFKTGFSFTGSSWTDSYVEPSIYAPFSTFEDSQSPGAVPYYGGGATIMFSGQVAWVDENGSGNPYDPMNKIYIGMEFYLRDSLDGTFGNFSHHTNKSVLNSQSGFVSSKLSDLKLRLSDESFVKAAIYGSEENEYELYTTASATDWIFEAVEWWPYQNGGGNVWNPATGEPA
jgi:hypothetical protein